MAGKYGRLIGNRVFEKTPRAVRSDDRDSHVEMKEWQQRERAQAREQTAAAAGRSFVSAGVSPIVFSSRSDGSCKALC